MSESLRWLRAMSTKELRTITAMPSAEEDRRITRELHRRNVRREKRAKREKRAV